MPTPQNLIATLASHIGQCKGITAQQLAALLCCPPRRVRLLVTEARLEGSAICGTPRDGYYLASSAEELQATIDFLKGRALCSLQLASRMSHVPMPDLLGQLHLPT